MYNFYPISLDLKNRKCLVVGGGRVAERKVRSLLQCGAHVWVVSPELTGELQKLAAEGTISFVRRHYATEDLEECFLVISAVDDHEINSRVANDCSERSILVNVVDDPPRCLFAVPSVLRRGSLCIAVSTDGKSPLLARRIREELESLFGAEYDEFLEIMGEVRSRVLREIPDKEERRRIFECLINSDLLKLIREGERDLVEERVAECMLS